MYERPNIWLREILPTLPVLWFPCTDTLLGDAIECYGKRTSSSSRRAKNNNKYVEADILIKWEMQLQLAQVVLPPTTPENITALG